MEINLSGKNCCYEVKDLNESDGILDEALKNKQKEIHTANFILHVAHLLETTLYWSDNSLVFNQNGNDID